MMMSFFRSMLQRNEIISDYLLLSRFFLDLIAYNLQKIQDNLLLSHFLKDLTADYHTIFCDLYGYRCASVAQKCVIFAS